MKKFISGLTIMCVCLAFCPAQAQNCVNSARCDELGYKYKAEDCTTSNILACPFDASKVYCAKLKELTDGGPYQNGDPYLKNGVLLGYVFDATDCTDEGCTHGKIYKAMPADTYLGAVAFCEVYAAGGKQWRLPYSKDEYELNKKNTSKIPVGDNEVFWTSKGSVGKDGGYVAEKMYMYMCNAVGEYVRGSTIYVNYCTNEQSMAQAKEVFHCVTEF